jgi:hypothetical protein
MSIIIGRSIFSRISSTSSLSFYYSKALIHNYICDPSIGLSPEEKEIQQVAKDFARNELYPKMAEFDEKVSIS